ncbi:hypothetical protein KA013_00760 [Patescibacteria group bacterium]|nr:hypothetical protein [Patescibacteria group bacterium]
MIEEPSNLYAADATFTNLMVSIALTKTVRLTTPTSRSSLNNILPHRLANISIAIFFHQLYQSLIDLSDELWSLEDHASNERD